MDPIPASPKPRTTARDEPPLVSPQLLNDDYMSSVPFLPLPATPPSPPPLLANHGLLESVHVGVPAPPPKKKRASKPKVRSGCITCKIRRVKCDEGKPTCTRCARADIKCDGYAKDAAVQKRAAERSGVIRATERNKLLLSRPDQAHTGGSGYIDSQLPRSILLNQLKSLSHPVQNAEFRRITSWNAGKIITMREHQRISETCRGVQSEFGYRDYRGNWIQSLRNEVVLQEDQEGLEVLSSRDHVRHKILQSLTRRTVNRSWLPQGHTIKMRILNWALFAHKEVGTRTDAPRSFNSMVAACSDGRLQALPIQKYMAQTWPLTWYQILSLVRVAEDNAEMFVSPNINHQVWASVKTVLPNLIKTFAIKLGQETNKQVNRDIMDFVHKHAMEISEQIDRLITEYDDLKDQSGKMSVEEKMDRWMNDLGTDVHIDKTELFQGVKDIKDGDLIDSITLLEYNRVVTGSSSFAWLSENLRKEMCLHRDSNDTHHASISACIQQHVLEYLPTGELSKLRPPNTYEVYFRFIGWAPRYETSYDNQKPPESLDQEVFNPTVLVYSLFDAQAIAVEHYMKQVWPSTWRQVYDLLAPIIRGSYGDVRVEVEIRFNTFNNQFASGLCQDSGPHNEVAATRVSFGVDCETPRSPDSISSSPINESESHDASLVDEDELKAKPTQSGSHKRIEDEGREIEGTTDSSSDCDSFSMSDSSITLESPGVDPTTTIVREVATKLLTEYRFFRPFGDSFAGNCQDTAHFSPSVPSSNSQEAQISSAVSQNSRKRTLERANDGDGKKPDESTSSKRPKKGSEVGSEKFLACPFWKLQSSAHRSCFSLKLKRIRDVKQHLSRRHTPAYYCDRCSTIFEMENDLHEHVSNPAGLFCSPGSTLEGISRGQRMQLKGKSDKNLSEEGQWFAIWDIVFPGRERPMSAYLELEIVEDVYLFQDYCRNHGGAVLATQIQMGNSYGLTGGVDADRQFYSQAAFRQAMDLLLNEWVTSRSSGTLRNSVPVGDGQRPSHESLQPTIQAESSSDSGIASSMNEPAYNLHSHPAVMTTVHEIPTQPAVAEQRPDFATEFYERQVASLEITDNDVLRLSPEPDDILAQMESFRDDRNMFCSQPLSDGGLTPSCYLELAPHEGSEE
ncbi:hypothetical protein CcaCcLH18_01244 [Colletotrichum camelliae]|nr:hypothetical protein CcaCcLH18_01244 [Colletotrichum camelliae]